MKKLLYLIAVLILTGSVTGCFTMHYGFTGAALTADMKTISVAYFPNRAPIVNPTLSQELTEKLKDKFISQTSLNMISGDGDLSFEGEITGYDTKPIAITGNDQTEKASLNRLTITIKVKFVNQKEPKSNFDAQFMAYEDYSSDKGLDAVEGDLVPLILEKLIEDIFNKSVVNW
ncbi:MAG: LptE family protein [Bacteroidia bacterium]|nr:LptE family protein [Bacteroidia bacterium]